MGDHVGGDVADGPARPVGVAAEPYQCLGDPDPELDSEDP
jgi:hypothetical protein